MSSTKMIANWYEGVNVFITGGSGFLGICLIEKLLRCIPNIGYIYLLLRPKRGKTVEQRLEQIKNNAIFERLLTQQSIERVFRRLKVIAGDVSQPKLGLSTSERQILVENVNVIFHSAATLDFADGLKPTVLINLLGTRQVLELAAECRDLTAFVHVSSAYVNSFLLEADEIIYPLNNDAKKIIELVNKLTEKELNKETLDILKGHPNTYTFTKQMAEHEVQKMEKRFPCAIVRPSMITGAWKEPVPGWTNSKNGPQGFFMGAAKGIIRRLPVGKNLIYDYIPVDLVVNQLIVAGCYAGIEKSGKVHVFHATSSTRQPFRWVEIQNKVNSYLHKFPLKSAVWYPHLKLLPSVTWFKISAFFVHFLPALVLDGLTKLTGGRPILLKLHRNVNISLGRLEKFIFTEFIFNSNKTEKLQKWLTPEDKDVFNLDITSLEWPDYFNDLARGVRIYLNNEKMSNIEAARGKNFVLMLLHMLLQIVLCALVWYLFACISGQNMTKCGYVVPIFYILFSFL
ncbi:hypothetical protein FQA39_LY18146 [Lamprigera yunnana]|nr:hypothetical protein FQA39_LY18146 [Lamprigera yunnana]